MYNISQKPIFPFNFRTDVKDPAIKPAFDKIYTLLDEMVSKFNTNAKDLENYIARFGPTQYLVATDRIEHLADTYEIIAKGATGVTMTSTPTISNSYGGARLLLIGTDDTRTVTLQDDSVLPGSNLYLGAPTVTLDAGAVCYLVYSEAIGKWCKTSVATSVLPGTVSSVGLSAPTGFTVTNSPITSFGTIALSFSAGYSLPLTTDTAKGVTAYGWGNHASAGYLTAVIADSPLSGSGTSGSHLVFTNPGYIMLDDLTSSATGLTYTNTTGDFSLTSGYVIPTTTEESNWNTAYGWGDHAGLYLKLDQTTPETIINGIPLLEATRVIDQDHEIVDKLYADTVQSGGMKSFFFTKTASDVGGMYKAVTTFPPGGIKTITGTAYDGETVIASFITDVATSEYRVIDGSRFFYFTAQVSNVSKPVQLKGYVYQTDIYGGNPVLLRESSLTPPLTLLAANSFTYVWGSALLIPVTMRIKFVVAAVKTGTGVDPTVTLSVEDDTFSRLDVPSPTGVTDITGVSYNKQTEIDFGATPVESATFTITDSDITTASKIIGQIAYVAPTGKELDELEFDSFDIKFAPAAGSCTLFIRSLEGYVADKFKLNYSFNKS